MGRMMLESMPRMAALMTSNRRVGECWRGLDFRNAAKPEGRSGGAQCGRLSQNKNANRAGRLHNGHQKRVGIRRGFLGEELPAKRAVGSVIEAIVHFEEKGSWIAIADQAQAQFQNAE